MATGNAFGPKILLFSVSQVSDFIDSIFVVFEAQNHMILGRCPVTRFIRTYTTGTKRRSDKR
jgi:hypothetical protein